MKRLTFILPFFLLLTACEVADILRPVTPAISGGELVVEGWIDDGGYPIVSVTTTLLRPDEPQDVRGLVGLVAMGAEVSVSDGTRTVSLKGSLTKDFFPSYVYTTKDMTGEAGKRYTLHVRYQDLEAEAVTTIPEKTELISLEVVQAEEDILRIYAGFTPDPAKCYGFFSKEKEDDFGYMPVFLGFIDGAAVSGPQTVSITRGSGLTSLEDYKPGFEAGETVCIRFSTMDREMYRFWEVFEQLTGVSYIMTYPSSFDNLPSNVTGAYGYWAGYGTSVYEITLPEKEEE